MRIRLAIDTNRTTDKQASIRAIRPANFRYKPVVVLLSVPPFASLSLYLSLGGIYVEHAIIFVGVAGLLTDCRRGRAGIPNRLRACGLALRVVGRVNHSLEHFASAYDIFTRGRDGCRKKREMQNGMYFV